MSKGRIVWYELLTTDRSAAIAFYTEVLGWKTEAFGDNYTMFVTAQGPVGGIGVLPEKAIEMGARPYWQGNVSVGDLDAAVAKVKAAGGEIIVAEEVPTIGRFAVIKDPQGAVIALYKPTREMPDHTMNQPGEVSWNELYADDNEKAFAFYADVVGWDKLATDNLGDHGTYIRYGTGGTPLGGMMKKPMPNMPSAWMYYICVEDLEATFARATSHGATTMVPVMAIPNGTQRFAILGDPQGAAFALITPPK